MLVERVLAAIARIQAEFDGGDVVAVTHGGVVFALERHPPGEQPEEDAPERVEVGRRARRVAGSLLRRPVLRCSGQHARDRRARRAAHEAREPEVRHDDTAGPALDEDVRRREIAVHDTTCVGVREPGRDRRAVASCLLPSERATARERVKAVAVDELEHEHGAVVVVHDHCWKKRFIETPYGVVVKKVNVCY